MATQTFTLLTLLLGSYFFFLVGWGPRALPAGLQNTANDCSEMASSIPMLRSEDETKRENAKKEILLASSKSERSRRCAIQKMLNIAAFPNSLPDQGATFFMKSPELFLEWKEATDMLGTLKATEAMDVLIDCLDCNGGKFGLGIGQFPATTAIVKFGDQAIPKLERALQGKKPGIRIMTVQALHAIGGEKARLILITSLKTETDKSVTEAIKNMLLSWSTSGPSKT